MQSGSNNGLRQVGVLKNPDQGEARESAPPEKITHIAKAETYVIRYGDKQGVAHAITVLKIGDQWYMPENSEAWSKNLKPLIPWMVKQAMEATAPAAAPKPDTIDVLGAGG